MITIILCNVFNSLSSFNFDIAFLTVILYFHDRFFILLTMNIKIIEFVKKLCYNIFVYHYKTSNFI